jgi:hypothetical protein
MSKKLKMSQDMAPELLEHLSQRATLPSQGIVAGQALASAVMDLYGQGGGVYNDIDVFVLATDTIIAEFKAELESGELAGRLGMTRAGIDEYLNADTGQAYRIEGSTREGLLNYVWCTFDFGQLSATRILSSFDLNCVEVALDLSTRKLYWTPAFEDFVQGYQLKLTTLATPTRTLIRYLKKRDELKGVFADDMLNMSIIASAGLARARSFERLNSLPEENLLDDPGTLDTSGDLLDPPVRLDEEEQTPGITSVLAEVFRKHAHAHRVAGFFSLRDSASPGLYSIQVARVPSRAVLHHAAVLNRHFASIYELPRVIYAKTRTYSGHVQAQQVRISTRDNLHEFIVDSLVTYGGSYLEGGSSDTHVDVVSRCMTRHPRMYPCLHGLTLDRQYHAVRELASHARAKGLWIYGLVETQAVSLDLSTTEALTEFLESRASFGTEALKAELFPAGCYKGWEVRELTTRSALAQEGAELGHCVEGYAEGVAAGGSVIISIRKGGDRQFWSTVELDGGLLRKKNTLRVSQHYTHANKAPSPENARVLEGLLRVLRRAKGLKLPPRVRRYNPEDFDLAVLMQ